MIIHRENHAKQSAIAIGILIMNNSCWEYWFHAAKGSGARGGYCGNYYKYRKYKHNGNKGKIAG